VSEAVQDFTDAPVQAFKFTATDVDGVVHTATVNGDLVEAS
jgi:hypothetical protein